MINERYYLKEIQIEGFRWINNDGSPLKINFDNLKVNSLFASNGMGKTSLFEALTFAFTGKIERLDKMSTNSEKSDYYNNLFHSKKEAIIKLQFESDLTNKKVGIEIKRNKSER